MSNSLDSFLTRIGDVTIERVAPRSNSKSNASGTDEVTMTSSGSNQGILGGNDEDSEETGGETSEGEMERKNMSMHRDDMRRSNEDMNSEGSGDDMDLDETIDTEIGVRMDSERQQSESSCPDDDVEAVNILDTLPLEGAPIEGQEVSEADLLGKPLSKDDSSESLCHSPPPHSDPEDTDPSKRRGTAEEIDQAKKKQKLSETADETELKSEKKLSNMRRNIREVMDETQLDEATLSAQRQEMERLRRVQEQQRIIREVQRQIANHRQSAKSQPRVISLLQGKQNEMGTTISQSPSSSQIKSPTALLMNMHSPPNTQSSSSTQPGSSPRRPLSGVRWKGRGGYQAQHQAHNQMMMSKMMMKGSAQTVLQQRIRMMTPSVSISPVVPKREPMDHVPYYSDSDMSEGEIEDMNTGIHRIIPTPKSPKPVKGKDVVTISSSSESSDDDCIVLSDPSGGEETDTEDDPSNSGMHTNDRYNIPDEVGRVLINVGHPDGEPDVFLAPQVARIIKPHQIGGIRFLFDNIVESIERFKSSSGFGCILAHSMGLGKTLQVASFCDIFFRCTNAKTVLCIMPINTLQNWLAEFNMWLPYEDPDAVKADASLKKAEQKCDIKEENSNQTDISSLSSRSMSTDSRSQQEHPQLPQPPLPTSTLITPQFQNYETPQIPPYYPDILKTHENTSHIPQNFPIYSNVPQSYPQLKQELDCPPNPTPYPQMYPMNQQNPSPYPSQYQNYPPPPPQDEKLAPPQNPTPSIKKEPEEPLTKEESTSTSKEDSQDLKKNSEKVPTPFSVDAPLGLEVRPRHFHLHILNDSHKTMAARARVIREWQKVGGVLLIGYELYRQLSLKKSNKGKRKRGQQAFKDNIEVEEENKNKPLLDEMHGALVNPGPDLVICDEGHRIKNSHASISLALKQMRTKRRIVLTGYPLQNNLLEYWCMVDFVRPNYLGTKAEFCNMFERPIQNGQCIDSTPQDIRLMRYRAHVLHALLEGFVQRRSHSVLQISLPRKEEYILLVRMTPHQRKLYDTFMNQVVKTRAVPNPLKAFAVCCKIWNHPDILYHFLRKRQGNEEDDLDLGETIEKTTAGNKKVRGRGRGEKKGKKVNVVKSKPAASVQPNSLTVNDNEGEIGENKGNFGNFQQVSTNLINPNYSQNYQEFRGNEGSNYFRGETGEFNEFYNNQNQRFQGSNQQFQGFSQGNSSFQGNYQNQNFTAGEQNQGNQKFMNGQNSEFREQGNNTNYDISGFNRSYQFQDQRNYPNSGNNSGHQGNVTQNYQNQGQNSGQMSNSGNSQINEYTGYQQNSSQSQNYQQSGSNNQMYRDNQLGQHPYPPSGQNQPSINQNTSAPQTYINNPTPAPSSSNYAPGGQNQGTGYQQNPPQGQVFPPQQQQPQQNYINNQNQNQLRYQNPQGQSFPPQGYPLVPPTNQQHNPQGQRYPAPQQPYSAPQNQPETPNQSSNYQTQNFPSDATQQNSNQNQFKQEERFPWQGNYQQLPQPTWDTNQPRYPGNYYPQTQNYPQNYEFQQNPEVSIKTEEKPPQSTLLRPNESIGIQTQTLPTNYTQTPPEISNQPPPIPSIPPLNFQQTTVSDPLKEEEKEKEEMSLDPQKEEKSDDEVVMKDEEKDLKNSPNGKEDPGIPYDWATELMKGYVEGLIDASAKMTLFFCILEESIRLGDRVLLFSQSLFTLNLIEDFLARNDFKNPDGTTEKWFKNVNYYRLDGSTSALEREKLINEFNVNPRIHLFLVSTRAGSLGINLVGANRAIVFDASWNPCHDTQAVCRVYRYGQKKPCYVYRLVTDNCLERKIYDRQISKQGMADRVVDQCNPDAHLSLKEATTLSWDFEEDSQVQDFSSSKDTYTDQVMHTVLEKHSSILTKQPFHHESLLVDRKDKKLSQAEKRLARRGYELEKMAANCSRPSYNYIPGNTATRAGGLQIRAIRDTGVAPKPVASVRPMQQRAEGLGARGVVGSRWIPAEVWQRQGMSAQEMTLPLDVVIPTNSPDKSSIVLKAGQRVMVLKSPKGIYMQLESGKIIAIRTALKLNQQKREEEPKKRNEGITATVTSPRAKPDVGFLRNNSAISIIPKTTSAPATPRPLSRPSSGSGYKQFPDKDMKRGKSIVPTPVVKNLALNNQVSLQRISKGKEMDHSAGENSNSSDSQPRIDQRVEEVRLEDIVGEGGSEFREDSGGRGNREGSQEDKQEIRSFGTSKGNVQSIQAQQTEEEGKGLRSFGCNQRYSGGKEDDEIIIEENVRSVVPPIVHQIHQVQGNSQGQTSVINPQGNSQGSVQVNSQVNPPQGKIVTMETSNQVSSGGDERQSEVQDDPHGRGMPQAYPYAEYPRYYEYPDPRARGLGANPGGYGGFYGGGTPAGIPGGIPGGAPGGKNQEVKGEDRAFGQGVQGPGVGQIGQGGQVGQQVPVEGNMGVKAEGVAPVGTSVPTAFSHPPGGRYPTGYPPAPYDAYSGHYPPGSTTGYPPGTPGYGAYGTPSYNADYARMYSALHPPPPVADPYMHRGYAPPPTNTPSNYYAPFPHPPPPPYPNYSYFPAYSNPNIPNESQPPTQ